MKVHVERHVVLTLTYAEAESLYAFVQEATIEDRTMGPEEFGHHEQLHSELKRVVGP